MTNDRNCRWSRVAANPYVESLNLTLIRPTGVEVARGCDLR